MLGWLMSLPSFPKICSMHKAFRTLFVYNSVLWSAIVEPGFYGKDQWLFVILEVAGEGPEVSGGQSCLGDCPQLMNNHQCHP